MNKHNRSVAEEILESKGVYFDDPRLSSQLQGAIIESMNEFAIQVAEEADEIEVRKADSKIDEILVWKDGECFVHIEKMDESWFWIRIGERHFNFRSKSGRAKVEIIET